MLVGTPGASVPQGGTVLLRGIKATTGRIVRQEVINEPPPRTAVENAPLQDFVVSDFTDITRFKVRLNGKSITLSVGTAATAVDNVNVITGRLGGEGWVDMNRDK